MGPGLSAEKVSVNVKGGLFEREKIEGAESETLTVGVLAGEWWVSKLMVWLPPTTSQAILVVDGLGISIAVSESLETRDRELRDTSVAEGQCVIEAVGLKQNLYL